MTFPEPEATWLPHADAEEVGTESVTRFVAPGTAVHGEFGLFEFSLPPGRQGALPHYHTGFSESFYVLSGRLAVMTGLPRGRSAGRPQPQGRASHTGRGCPPSPGCSGSGEADAIGSSRRRRW